ncbi:hypothetical protein J4Q44_G00182240 [Coregonus suidteri]|uniref:PiggyBac transposable element-derived protein domain-containing protein n=1 Tax=Coregonus suidteri TaxID=861788 RepID=A0AAN8QQI1_9TELE
MHKDASLSAREDIKPQIILDYNSTKGGVDNLDKVTATYSCQRMTARWPFVIFYNIVDVSAYNAYVLWTEINQQWNGGKLYRRRLFLEELGKALITPKIQRRVRPPRSTAAASAVQKIQAGPSTHASNQPEMDPVDTGSGKKRKRCQLCPPRQDNEDPPALHGVPQDEVFVLYSSRTRAQAQAHQGPASPPTPC